LIVQVFCKTKLITAKAIILFFIYKKLSFPEEALSKTAVFRLTENGIELKEYAPGIDIEKDIISKMEFEQKPVAI